MEAVLDAPVLTGDFAEAFGAQRRAEQVVSRLGGDFVTALAGPQDLADGRQARPGMLLLEPGDIA